LFSFRPKPIIAEHRSRVDGVADFRDLFFAQLIGEQLTAGRLSRLPGLPLWDMLWARLSIPETSHNNFYADLFNILQNEGFGPIFAMLSR